MENWGVHANVNGFKNEKEMLKSFYYEDLLSLAQIGAIFNVSKFCIDYRMRKYNLKKRKIGYGKSYTGRKNGRRL